eukprot:402744-Rhodomonas_salina.3
MRMIVAVLRIRGIFRTPTLEPWTRASRNSAEKGARATTYLPTVTLYGCPRTALSWYNSTTNTRVLEWYYSGTANRCERSWPRKRTSTQRRTEYYQSSRTRGVPGPGMPV